MAHCEIRSSQTSDIRWHCWHNGGAFSAENIRFLIEQVSSKDGTNDSNGRPTTTGRFGTGFLTTHLLSERVFVRGVAAGKGYAPRKFKLTLDRSGLSPHPAAQSGV
jgi:hypothetical protein